MEDRRATELDDVEELEGDEIVTLLSVSDDFSVGTAGGLRRDDTCALRTWRRPLWTWLLIEDCSFVVLRVREFDAGSLLTKRKFVLGMMNDEL